MGLPVAHVELDRNREEREEASHGGGAREVEARDRESREGDAVEREENWIRELLEDQSLVDGLRETPGEKRQDDAHERDPDRERKALLVELHPAYIRSSVPKRSAISSVF